MIKIKIKCNKSVKEVVQRGYIPPQDASSKQKTTISPEAALRLKDEKRNKNKEENRKMMKKYLYQSAVSPVTSGVIDQAIDAVPILSQVVMDKYLGSGTLGSVYGFTKQNAALKIYKPSGATSVEEKYYKAMLGRSDEDILEIIDMGDATQDKKIKYVVMNMLDGDLKKLLPSFNPSVEEKKCIKEALQFADNLANRSSLANYNTYAVTLKLKDYFDKTIEQDRSSNFDVIKDVCFKLLRAIEKTKKIVGNSIQISDVHTGNIGYYYDNKNIIHIVPFDIAYQPDKLGPTSQTA